MTRYFEILIEKENIPIDLSIEEINRVPHYSIFAKSYDKFVIRLDIKLQHKKQGDFDDFKYLAHKIINRYYKKVISITEFETPIAIESKEHFNNN